jgi:TetR/AcrR family transcriptional regulator, copper-responsive repressor
MVQKSSTERRPRGRPRVYDPELALQQALEVFWKAGYAATSLDDLAAATGMNRPSLYAGFGDKRSIYLKALTLYWETAAVGVRAALTADQPLADALMQVYRQALTLYFSGKGKPRGCFTLATAVTESGDDPLVREFVGNGFRKLDQAFKMRIRTARDKGELAADVDPDTLAGLASAVHATLGVRARAGIARAELEEFARKSVESICRNP